MNANGVCWTRWKAGYRSLDTAQSYFNEEGGLRYEKSGIPREEIFPDFQGVGGALRI